MVFYVKQTMSVHSSMSSLADAPDLVGFFSYSREDDEGSGGKLSKLRKRIQEELRGQLGRTKRDFRLWQDKVAIAHGELWQGTIKKGISESVFFIPIITPTAVRSSHWIASLCPGAGLFITLMRTLFVSLESRSCP